MEHLLHIINHAFPEIEWVRARVNDLGWDHHVVILDDRHVFRFPKAPAEPGYFDREIALLALLPQYTRVGTPRITHVSGDRKIIGYAYLPGEPLETALVDHLPSTSAQAVAEQLATLLGDVHGIPLDACAHLDLIVRRAKDHMDWLQAGIAAHLRSALSAQECGVIADFLPEFDHCMSSCPHYVLLHGDLGLDGMIFDRNTGEISVIDWTNFAWGDPASDFVGLLAEAPALAREVVDRYPQASRYGDLLGRAAIYNKMIAVGLMIHSFMGQHEELDKSHGRFRRVFDL